MDVVPWDTWNPAECAVLCFVRNRDRILLIRKKSGMGAGKINGPGGRVKADEHPADAAIRETEEETGLRPGDVKRCGDLSFVFRDGYSLYCTVFISHEFSGVMRNTPEADPFWCRADRIPYEEMWEDDVLWLPRLLEGKVFRGFFVFDGDVMLSHRLSIEEPVDGGPCRP